MFQHEFVTDLPNTPEDLLSTTRSLESHAPYMFVRAAAQLTDESRFESSSDLGLLPDSVQTQAYMNGALSHEPEATRMQSILIRAGLGRLMLRKRVPQSFVISPDSLNIPHDSNRGPLISNEILRDQMTYLVGLIDEGASIQVRIATHDQFIQHGLADLGTNIIRPHHTGAPMATTQNRYRMTIADSISTVDLIDAWSGLRREAIPSDESLDFMKARLRA
jgi:hypothetical protein